MKRQLLIATCMAVALGATTSLTAQSGAMGKDQMMKDSQMTVSGCVAAGKESGQFMLTHAMKSEGMMGKDKMDKDKMDKPGMSGKSMMSYELVGGNNLKAHMGHKVEVMGTMSKTDMEHMAKMDDMPKDKIMDGMDMKAMKLNVTTVKMISATCP